MKKQLLILCFIISIISNAQVVTIYSEDFDNGGGYPNGWSQTQGADWLIDDATGTGNPGPGSGSWQIVNINSTGATEELTIDIPIITTSLRDITIQWDAYKDPGFPALTFEWSTDGASWNTQAFTDVAAGSWATITPFTLPAGADNQSNLRLRITLTSDGFGTFYIMDDFLIEGTPFRYYSKAVGNLEDVNSWSLTPDGLGVSPPNFTEDGVIYVIINNPTPTITANWTISGLASQLSVGDGTFTTNFTIPASASYTGTVNVNNNATLTINHLTVNPTIGTLAVGSTVAFGGAGAQTLPIQTPPISYYNLTCSGTGAKTQTTTNVSVNGDLNITAPATYQLSTSFGRALTLNGTVSGTGTFTGNSTNTRINALGSTVMGSLNFTAGSQVLNTFNMNISGGGSISLGSNLTIGNSLTLANGALVVNGQSLTFSGSTYSRTNGTFTGSSTSNLAFTGSGANTFTVALTQTSQATRTLNNFTVSRTGTGGVTLSNPLEIVGDVTLGGRTLTTGGNLTLKCSSSQCARIATITGTGAISGNVTVERFSPGNYTGWGLLGSPITSALTMSAWDDDIAISCSDCPDGTAAGFTSIYTYNEPFNGAYNAAGKYVPIPGYAAPITNGVGYYVYYGTGYTITTDITLDVTGTVRTGAYNLAPSYTNNTGGADDGWNLLANPYPSPISWASLHSGAGTPANIENTYYSYNADLNGHTGGFANYNFNTGISTPAVGSGGVDDDIPMGQGFFVHLTGATTLIADETHKVDGNPTFRKNGNTLPSTLATQYFRLQLTGPSSFKDETVLSFYPGATDSFDTQYDARKLFGSHPNSPHIAFLTNGDMYSVNNLPPLTQNISLPVYVKTVVNGTYTFKQEDIGNIPGACITLYDTSTGITTDLRTSNYAIAITPGTYTGRFILNITAAPTFAFNSSVSQPTCTSINDGFVYAAPTNSGPWDYVWRDSITHSIIQHHTNISTPDTLFNVGAGVYIVEINSTGMCDFATQTFNISAPLPNIVPLLVSTVNNATCYNQNNGYIAAQATGTGPWNYFWTDSTSGLNVQTHLNISTPDTLHNLNAGTYIVQIRSVGGCDSAVQYFTVIPPAPTSASFATSADTVYTSLGGNVTFTNNSINATSYLWDFGDLSASSTSANPTHAYTTPGTYTVTLKAYNLACNDSSETTYVINVLTSPSSINASVDSNKEIFIGQDENGAFVRFASFNQSNALISVTNLLGQKVTTDIRTKVNGQTIYLNLSGINNKVLFVTVTDNEKQITKKIYNN